MIPDDPARAAVVRSTPDFVGWPDDVARHYREVGWWAARVSGLRRARGEVMVGAVLGWETEDVAAIIDAPV